MRRRTLPDLASRIVALVAAAVLPGVLAAQGGAGTGPLITIRANDEPFLHQALRDNETVSADQLGAYLSRLAFSGSKSLPITPSAGDALRATVKAKFELRLADRSGGKLVLKMTFDELRLARTAKDGDTWLLTREGILQIVKNVPKENAGP